jgi:hypothetical protein
LPLLERVVVGLEVRGIKPESIVGALVHYAKKSLPSLHRRHSGHDAYTHGPLVPATVAPTEDDHRIKLETIEVQLSSMSGVVSTCFLFESLYCNDFECKCKV